MIVANDVKDVVPSDECDAESIHSLHSPKQNKMTIVQVVDPLDIRTFVTSSSVPSPTETHRLYSPHISDQLRASPNTYGKQQQQYGQQG